jgi:hypothetical protein
MRQLSVNKFRANLKKSIDQAISKHEPLRVVRREGGDTKDYGKRTEFFTKIYARS